jgi:3-isopropylmalate/(R)-2-methylmalate dehydratase small subunit
MTNPTSKIESVKGRALPLRGDDIDTDRIIPARFLKTITFEGLEDHLFEDDRAQLKARGVVHAFDAPAYQGAHLLIVQGNFGCGSSREHAPQAIARSGLRAIVGNSLIIGLPCVTAERADVERLLRLAETHPETEFVLDLHTSRVTGGNLNVLVTLPEATRSALLSGNWDATGLLVDRYEEVEAVSARLPYVSGWNGR